MRIVRSFDPTAIAPGSAGSWLVGPEENEGVAIRLRRGGGTQEIAPNPACERFALVIEGSVTLLEADASKVAQPGELIFIPASANSTLIADATAIWAEIEAPVAKPASDASAKVIPVDKSRFEGTGFAYQSLIDRTVGCQAMRMNVLQVESGAGSPDWHIHAFTQIYLIQEGELTLDVGKHRHIAPANSIVVLPAGVVHRNFNASAGMERHVSLLVPEPLESEIFDFAVTIHEVEADLLTAIPA